MAIYVAKLTAVGLAKLAAASTGGPNVVLTTMCIDDGGGNPVSLDPVPSELVRKVHETQINALYVNPNDPTMMMAEMVIPSDKGGWSIRGVGIRDAAGALFAYAKFPETYKPTAEEAGTRDMIIHIAIKVGNSADVELVIDTSIVAATRPWVIATITTAFLIPGGATDQLLAKASNLPGHFKWVNRTDAVAIAVDAKVEVQATVAGQAIYTLVNMTTDGVSVYIEGVRIFGFTVLNATQIQLNTPHAFTGHEIGFVQNEPNEPLKLRQLVAGRIYFTGQFI